MSKVKNWQLGARWSTRTTRVAPRSSGRSSSTSTSASRARPARWPARPPGPAARARNTCSGTTWRPSPTAATRWPGTCACWRSSAAGVGAEGQVPGQDHLRGGAADGARAALRAHRRGLDVPQRRRGRLRRQVPQRRRAHRPAAARPVVLLPAAHLRALHLPRLPRGLPAQGHLQARGGRHRPHRPVRCKGYGECVRACPYKKSMYNPHTRTSEKCVGCYPAVEQGIQPQCVVNCIGKIRVMGFINPPWKARADNPSTTWCTRSRSRCRTTRSSASSRTSITSRPSTRIREYLGRCSAPRSTAPSSATRAHQGPGGRRGCSA
jgi:ferredoxin